MHIIDAHCDTLTKIYRTRQGIFQNTHHVDIKRMMDYSSFTQVFACFIAPEFRPYAKKYALDVFKNFKNELEDNKEFIGLATNFKEYTDLKNAGKITAFFSIEGGEAIEDVSDIDSFYELGVRIIALAWNHDNALASGVLGDVTRGVTEFGKKVIKRMTERKMIVDVSHLNERSFYDVCEITKRPIIASHSDSFSVCKIKRNLTDAQFLEIKARDGFVGINLYPYFLAGKHTAGICDVLKTVEYFLSLGGENIIGLGCDFDGVDCLPDEISGVESVYKIFNEMQRLGYSKALMDKIAHKNFEKIIKLF